MRSVREEVERLVNRFPWHEDPRIGHRQKLVFLMRQKRELMRHDFMRRFQPTGKQMQFFNLDAKWRAIFAGNRCGKTVGGCAELTYHLTGQYPHWWKGHRFTRPVRAWASSTTKEKTIQGLQEMLLGKPGDFGTGFIPWARIAETQKMPNVRNGISRVKVVWGDPVEERYSWLAFKSYEQDRKAFETERLDIILLDEEPPIEIFRECQMRVLGTELDPGGIIMLTFTPLQGMTDVCLHFLQPEEYDNELPAGMEKAQRQAKWISASWEDNPHLSKKEVAELIRDTPPHELEARRHGRPSLGSGKIYAIPEDRFTVAPFEIPDTWPQALSLDHGYEHPAAVCVWARDPMTSVCYLVSTWKEREMLVPDMASVLRRMGADWKPIFTDPSGFMVRQDGGGRSIADLYQEENITLLPADNAVEDGIYDFRQGLINGTLKVFGFPGGSGPCCDFFDEFRLYHKNEKGKIVKVRDDLMDAARYGYRHRDEWARKPKPFSNTGSPKARGWKTA